MEEEVVFVDVESVKTANGSLVFSVTMKKVRNGDILCTRTLLNKDIIENIYDYDVSMCKKIVRTIAYLSNHCEPDPIFVNTNEMLTKIEDFIYRHGRVWVGHSVDRDLGFLYDTDRLYGNFFKVHPCGNDEICTDGYKWGRIAKICTQCIIPKRAPNFYKSYIERFGQGNVSMTMESLLSYCVPDQTVDHTSPSDVDQLILITEFIRNKDAQTFYFGNVSTYINKA